MSRARGIRLPDELDRHVERQMERSGGNWSEVVVELLEEAVRMRRAPGVFFAEAPAGRRAVVAGTGIGVWEIVAAWKTRGEDRAALLDDFSWLPENRVDAALNYYALYPDAIDSRLQREREWTESRVREELPFASPEGRRPTGPPGATRETRAGVTASLDSDEGRTGG